MKLAKRDKEWLSGLGLSLRIIAATLEGKHPNDPVYKAENAPKHLRQMAEALEKVGAGRL